MNRTSECIICGWCGTHNQKKEIRRPDGTGLMICPSCGNHEFYLLPDFKNGERIITDDNIKGIITGDYGHKAAVQYEGANVSVTMHKNRISRLIG